MPSDLVFHLDKGITCSLWLCNKPIHICMRVKYMHSLVCAMPIPNHKTARTHHCMFPSNWHGYKTSKGSELGIISARITSNISANICKMSYLKSFSGNVFITAQHLYLLCWKRDAEIYCKFVLGCGSVCLSHTLFMEPAQSSNKNHWLMVTWNACVVLPDWYCSI